MDRFKQWTPVVSGIVFTLKTVLEWIGVEVGTMFTIVVDFLFGVHDLVWAGLSFSLAAWFYIQNRREEREYTTLQKQIDTLKEQSAVQKTVIKSLETINALKVWDG